MSASVPESDLTTDELLRLSDFDRQLADVVDAAFGSGGGIGTVCFTYTVTGSESDLREIIIPLPVTYVSTEYAVYPQQSTYTNMLDARVLDSSKTVSSFKLLLSSAASAGDVFSFMVAALI